ncbi:MULTISPECIES: DUF2486 family protein [Mycetohabitans]|uniref:DUF2486 family protein n=1 Tax=Mycetohabitans TaxID=2571159 RepID=UPI0032537B45|nr:DUF2486 family protein [Mycetohabitans sp. B3]
MTDPIDESIPVLTNVLVSGAPEMARSRAQWLVERCTMEPACTPASRIDADFVPVPQDGGWTAPDVDRIVERLRARLGVYLTGEGRDAIEARCREAFAEHAGWLVSQVTREVVLTLETELEQWVHDALDAEIEQRADQH